MDINNPEMMKFLIENYEKATRLRMKWNTIHADKLNLACKLQREEKGYYEEDIVKEVLIKGLPNMIRDYRSSTRNRRLKPIRDGTYIPGVADMRKGHSIIDVGVGDPNEDPRLVRPDTDTTADPIMKPVNPKQTEILYKGKPDFGRKAYLKNRSREGIPEDRYYFAEASNWDYGWRMKESSFSTNVPAHGRVLHMEKEASRTGPQPDPVHYNQLPKTGKDIC